jgi:hypothetical protein
MLNYILYDLLINKINGSHRFKLKIEMFVQNVLFNTQRRESPRYDFINLTGRSN